VNSKCNLRCKICDVGQDNKESIFYQNLIKSSDSDMGLENYQRIVEQLGKDTFISITSTEPLLWPPIIQATEWTVRNGWQLNITTNGFLLPDMAERLARTGIAKITVSLDGPKDIHNGERGNELSYQRAIEGIRKIIDYKKKTLSGTPSIIINTVISPLNQGNICRFLEGLPLNDIDHVNIELMTFCTREIADIHNRKFGRQFAASQTCLAGGLDPSSINADLVLEDIKAAKKRFPKNIVTHFPMDKKILKDYFCVPGKFLTSARCIIPYFTAQIDTKGDLIGLTRCYPVTFGSALNDGFDEAWNSEEMRSFRLFLQRSERMPACSRCEGLLYNL